MTRPATLERAGIEARIPHRGSMCLLERLVAWDAEKIHCSTSTHLAEDNPLRTESGLLSPNAIEYAAQAMALHGALIAPQGAAPSAGFIASVRNVQLSAARLDEAAGELQVHARRLSGDAQQVLYEFRVADAQERVLAQGRTVVVLNTPIAGEKTP